MSKVFLSFRGRVCLSLALKALNIKSGDIIACQAFTCTAVPEAIESIGAKPLFIDIEEDSLTISESDLYLKLNSNVKAIIVQHTYGIKSDLSKIAKITSKFSMPIIEDCCHLPFVIEEKLSTYSSFRFYSFEWGKPLPYGIGGALIPQDKNLIDRCDKIFSELKRPPVVSIIKIEIQYYLFKYLYTPETYFLLKRLFHLFNRLGFSIPNKSEKKIILSNDEYSWQISPLVKKRILKLSEKTYQKIIIHNQLIKKIYQENIFQKEKLNLTIKSADFLLRYPIVVSNKKYIYEQSKNKNIEVSTWYRTPVDPLTLEDCNKRGWNIDSCTNALSIAKSILTLPMNKKLSLKKALYVSNAFKSLMRD